MSAQATPKANTARARVQATSNPPVGQLDEGLLLRTLIAFQKGDFSVRMPVDQIGIAGKIFDTVNAIFEMNDRMRQEFGRISNAVGKEGRISQRVSLGATAGGWADCVESVNELIGDLVRPSTEVARVIGAVAEGDLSQTMTLDVDGRALKGEFLHTARVVNTMVEQLNSFANEVTRVAREVGSEGKLGGQADVKGVAGVWKDLTDSVNSMAGNLTAQVRNIAEVTTAVANGDLSKKITVNVQGEILELKNTINTMVDQLNAFAGEVTRVAREVGTEGKLGGQAEVRGVGGVWKDLTDNVNLMAGNLTAQVRNIADVTTAVAKGDLSRKITVDVRGEILELKEHHQHDGGSAQRICIGSDARGARGGHRRKARRTGRCEGRGGRVEGSHGLGQLHDRQLNGAGAQHRRGDYGGRQGRPLAQDHGGCARRNSGAEEHHQHHGGPALVVRFGSDSRGQGSGHRGQARRPGECARRGRHVERSDGLRQQHGGQPDEPGAQHRRCGHRGRQGRSFHQNYGGRRAAKFRS